MTVKFRSLAVAAGIAMALAATSALAGKNDYVFEPVAVEVKNGPGSQLAVRLLHKPSGKPVEGAVIFRSRLDMSPDAMGEMTANHAAQPAKEPGVYRFNADLTMAGRWALKLMAKVPGESETVEGTVIFKAK
jgi:YtkA-like protein